MTNADLPEEKITPILLPNKAYFTTLLIKDVHNRNFHTGVSHTLTQIKSKYWLLQGQAQFNSFSKMSYLHQTSRRSPQSQANGPLAKN